jgi:TonB family protein
VIALAVAVVGLSVLAVEPRAAAEAPRAPADSQAPDGGIAIAPDAGSDDAAAPPGPPVKAPVPEAPVTPVYPEAAMKAGADGDVALILSIDAEGLVTDVEVEAGLPHGLTEAAVAAARAARFRPALDAAGRSTPVRLRWLIHFTLPEKREPAGPAPAEERPPLAPTQGATPAAPLPPGVERFPLDKDTLFTVYVRERGTGKELPTATVFLLDVGEVLHVDAHARAERRLPPGAYVVVLRAPGHVQEERIERLFTDQRLDRTYFLQKERLNEYETIVRARPPRAETGVVTLQAEEIHNIPGTFGDPFRTAMLLPGVGSIVSGLGYPVIRGEAPGQTGTFIDEVKVPLLYHLGFGPAVVHPLFLESLDFHPGNFPAEYGRFTGALILAHTTEPATDAQTMLSADLFKFSAFHTRPVPVAGHQGAISAAARYGTLAFLARAFDPRAVLEYWDYQLRADLKWGAGDVRVLLFGAQDTTGRSAGNDSDGNAVMENLVRIGFHRLVLRYRGRWGATTLDAGVEAGPDFTTATGNPDNNYTDSVKLTETMLRPHAATTVALGESFKLRLGADLLVQRWSAHVGTVDIPGAIQNLFFPRYGLTPGAFIQAEWQPTPRWLIRPGVRVDHYSYVFQSTTTTQTGIDPRLSARFQIRPGLFVKGGVGIYRSPPRFIVPWPGLTGFGLEQGLNQSNQASLGAEVLLPWDSTLDGQVYFNWLPRVSEFVFGQNSNSDQAPLSDQQGSQTTRGRSYGLELIARRRLGHRLFGWVTYTWARSERLYPTAGWRPADFDQTQLVNTVVSYALGRSWTVSSVFHYHTGRPYTPPTATTNGFQLAARDRNLNRLPDFWRVDFRIEKREAFDTWYLDFYVDWLNISLQREAVGWNESRGQPDTALVTIPTFGLQAVF